MTKSSQTIDRRDFMKVSMTSLAAMSLLDLPALARPLAKGTKVALVKTGDRRAGVQSALHLLSLPPTKNKKVFIKPNFNTADPFPGSTHNDTLAEIVRIMKQGGAAGIIVGDRSGPPPTEKVLADKGIPALAQELGFEVMNFEKLGDDGWQAFNPTGCHWPEGFAIPKAVVGAEYLVSTCCLKTHQYGGVFTLSLKLAVGLTPKKLMKQLHTSADMRRMIAEINAAYTPTVIVLDGMEAFVDGGPMTGKKVPAGVIVAGTDRVAVDAVGVAILKELGSNEAIMSKKIFEQEQILRAGELGLGVTSPEQIELVTPDDISRAYGTKVKAILAQG